MKEIYLEYKSKKYKTCVDKYKILIAEHYDTIAEFCAQLNKALQKNAESEYGDENYKTRLLINEVAFDHRRSLIVEINPFIKLDDFLKTTSKSISLKFVEAAIEGVEFDDMFLTFQHMYELISEEIIAERTKINNDEISLNFTLTPLTSKLFTKLVEPRILKNALYVNDADLSSVEKMKLYIDIVNKTASQAVDFDYYVLLHCYEFTKEIKILLDSLNSNVICLVFPYQIKVAIQKENICLLDKTSIDLMFDDDIYNKLILEYSDTNDILEYKKRIDNVLINNDNGNNIYNQIIQFI